MNDETLLKRITLNPAVLAGKPTLRGLCISVAQIVTALAHGVSEADLLEDYPELEPDDVRAALLYAGRLKQFADAKGVSLNRLLDEMSTRLLTEHDVEQRFRVRAALGSREDGLALLEGLERYDHEQGYTEEEMY